MAQPNYSFAKRQRELAKKKKREEKQQQKAAAAAQTPSIEPAPPKPVDPGST